MYAIDFAPDGKTYQQIERGSLDRIWSMFVSSIDIRQQIALNRFAKFRLRNEETDHIIGILPKQGGD